VINRPLRGIWFSLITIYLQVILMSLIWEWKMIRLVRLRLNRRLIKKWRLGRDREVGIRMELEGIKILRIVFCRCRISRMKNLILIMMSLIVNMKAKCLRVPRWIDIRVTACWTMTRSYTTISKMKKWRNCRKYTSLVLTCIRLNNARKKEKIIQVNLSGNNNKNDLRFLLCSLKYFNIRN